MISWRIKQLQMLNIEFIEQDRVLMDFVKEHNISTLMTQLGKDAPIIDLANKFKNTHELKKYLDEQK